MPGRGACWEGVAEPGRGASRAFAGRITSVTVVMSGIVVAPVALTLRSPGPACNAVATPPTRMAGVAIVTEPNVIGRRLKRLRNERGLSQTELAERAGVSPDLIAKLEQGTRQSARLTSVTRLAQALGALATMLPRLIGEARLTVRVAGAEAASHLAQAYQLAACLNVHMGVEDLAAIGAERAVNAAGQVAVNVSDAAAPIVVVDYDPTWPQTFDRLRVLVEPALAGLPARVEHVGSTAVPGLAAKPIIDIDVVVDSAGAVPGAIERLCGLGYRHEGNGGVPGREAFEPPPGLPVHHLYVVVSGSRSHLDHVLFRDLLRRDPEAAASYAAEKRRHAHLLPANRPEYEDAKSVIIEALIANARAEAGLSSGDGATSSGAE
jgi:GrpB-like predicted nucleotidyltransferase (UPF0157 family)/transcriptional regulator with XRE-family HTH domain